MVWYLKNNLNEWQLNNAVYKQVLKKKKKGFMHDMGPFIVEK